VFAIVGPVERRLEGALAELEPTAVPPRYRCAACGNVTRFDVTVRRRTKEFRHFTIGGEMSVDDVEVQEEVVEHVSCRWCGASGEQIEEQVRAEPLEGRQA
jgi:hypothetical protein